MDKSCVFPIDESWIGYCECATGIVKHPAGLDWAAESAGNEAETTCLHQCKVKFASAIETTTPAPAAANTGVPSTNTGVPSTNPGTKAQDCKLYKTATLVEDSTATKKVGSCSVSNFLPNAECVFTGYQGCTVNGMLDPTISAGCSDPLVKDVAGTCSCGAPNNVLSIDRQCQGQQESCGLMCHRLKLSSEAYFYTKEAGTTCPPSDIIGTLPGCTEALKVMKLTTIVGSLTGITAGSGCGYASKGALCFNFSPEEAALSNIKPVCKAKVHGTVRGQNAASALDSSKVVTGVLAGCTLLSAYL